MSKTGSTLWAIVLLVTIASSSANCQTNGQTVFELEGNVTSPVSLPPDVIAVLKSDKVVDGCFKTEGAGVNEEAWFEAAEFDLNDDHRADLIIKPKHTCLFGANQGPFWIFQNVHDGYQKVLSATGLKLTILPEKFNSFNTIRVGRAEGMKGRDTLFRFSQGKYRPAK
ncbi:MAG: hypothetical protein HOP17_01890 [Acidobacteria bacterium]|nr:hypothetical protein [Acidobacteriota bacterium]